MAGRRSEELALSSLILLAAAAAVSGSSPPAAVQSEASAFSREADGTYVIRRPIFAEQVPLAQATGGLITDFDANEASEFASEVPAERHRRLPDAPGFRDRQIERAFEEAVDQAQSAADE